MIEEVYISGKIGKAIYKEVSRYFSVGVEESDGPRECRPGDLSLFLDCRPDFSFIGDQNLNQQRIRDLLDVERKAHRALKLTISGFDGKLRDRTRSLSIAAAEELLQDQSVDGFVKNRLLARPLPDPADIGGALRLTEKLATPAVARLYREVLKSQDAIKILLEVWANAAREYFDDLEAKIEAENLFIKNGGFAETVSAIASKDINKLNLLVVKHGSNVAFNQYLRHGTWGAMFFAAIKKQLANKIASSYAKPVDEQRDETIYSSALELETDSIKQLIINFEKKIGTQKDRRKHLSADEAKNKVDKQIEAIVQQIHQVNVNRAGDFIYDLVEFQLEQGKKKYLAMTLCNLANTAMEVYEFGISEKLVEYAFELNVEDAVIWTTQAELLKRKGLLDEALAAYDATSERFPNDAVAQSGRAEVLKKLNRLNEALAAYDAIIERFPNDAVAQNGRAEVLKELNRLNEALAAYEVTIERFPNNAVAQCGRAEVLKELNRLNEALAAYDATIERFPNNAVAQTGRAEVLKELNRLNEALAAYDASIERFPDNAVAQTGRAEVLKELNRREEALEAYEATIDRFPNNVVAQNGRAEVLKELNRLQEALDAYEATIEQFPNDAVAQRGRAEVLKELNRLDDALIIYEKNIGQFPYDVVAQTGRAELLKDLNRLDEARIAYEKTIERFPNNLVARNGYANLLVLTDHFQKARSILSIENPISKEDWIGYHILAMSYLKSGHADEAIRRLTYGLKSKPWNKKSFAHALVVAKMRKREFAGALEILKDGMEDLTISQKRNRLLFLGHALAEVNKKNETVNVLNSSILVTAPSPRVHRLKDYLFQRYELADAKLPSPDYIYVLDREIEAEEFYFAMAN